MSEVPVVGGPFDGAVVRAGHTVGYVGPRGKGYAVYANPAASRSAAYQRQGDRYLHVARCASCGATGPAVGRCALCASSER